MSSPAHKPKPQSGRLFWLLLASAVASVIAGLFNHWHPHFAAEAWPGFFAALGFAAIVLAALGARALQPLLRRPENYYDASSKPEHEHD